MVHLGEVGPVNVCCGAWPGHRDDCEIGSLRAEVRNLEAEVAQRYPRRCSQCGGRWADRACGPTHALVTEELGIGDLRGELASLREVSG